MANSTMIRIGGRPVKVHVLRDLVAVRPAEAATNPDDAMRRAFGDRVPKMDVRDGFRPFVDAGWRFLRRKDLKAAQSLEGLRVAGVVRMGTNRYSLTTKRMTVKLRPDLDEGKAKAALAAQSLEPVRQLRFGRNLYEVMVNAETDVVEKAASLCDADEFDAAEPNFVEAITGPRF